MDTFKRETINEYTWNDLNCKKVVRHTKQRNKEEKEIKRRTRRRLKQKLQKELDTYEEIFNELEKCIEGTWIGYCKEDCEWFEELQHKLLSILRSR